MCTGNRSWWVSLMWVQIWLWDVAMYSITDIRILFFDLPAAAWTYYIPHISSSLTWLETYTIVTTGLLLCLFKELPELLRLSYSSSFQSLWYNFPIWGTTRHTITMQDLLQKKFAQGMAYVDLKKNNLKDVEAGQEQEMDTVDTEKNLAQFFDEVGQIKSEMERIKELLVKLQDMNDESKTVHKAQTMKELRDRMDKDVALVSFSLLFHLPLRSVWFNTLSAGRWCQRAKILMVLGLVVVESWERLWFREHRKGTRNAVFGAGLILFTKLCHLLLEISELKVKKVVIIWQIFCTFSPIRKISQYLCGLPDCHATMPVFWATMPCTFSECTERTSHW